MKKMKSFAEFKEQALRDKVVKKAYDELGPEFQVVSLFIEKRLQKGLTQGELARRVGTKQSAISRFESGTYNPSFQFLNKLAEGLGVEMNITIDARK